MNLHCKPVTFENRNCIDKLALFPYQTGYIESIEECMAEAAKGEEWKTVGIYDGTVLVGFAMYGFFSQDSPEGQVWLDRFLIDKKYQGKGYGKAAVTMLLERLEREYKQKRVYLSVYDINKAAIHVYEKAGFYFNGEFDENGERIMVYDF